MTRSMILVALLWLVAAAAVMGADPICAACGLASQSPPARPSSTPLVWPDWPEPMPSQDYYPDESAVAEEPAPQPSADDWSEPSAEDRVEPLRFEPQPAAPPRGFSGHHGPRPV